MLPTASTGFAGVRRRTVRLDGAQLFVGAPGRDVDVPIRPAGGERVVDVDLSSDQELLLQTTSRFIESTCPLPQVRALSTGDRDAGLDYRRQAAELGWFALLVPESQGGGSVSGNGVVDAALVATARGAQLQPGSFVGTNITVYALAAEAEAGADEGDHAKVLARLLSGDDAASWAAAGPGGQWDAGAGVRAAPADGGYTLTGTKTFVQDADQVDWLLVTAAADRGRVQFLVAADSPGVRVAHRDSLDVTRRFGDVEFDGVEVAASAVVAVPDVDALVDRQLQIASVLTLAESLGAMNHIFDLALDYAKSRIAFGRPIGSFQAVKHLLADTSLELEMSKAIGLAAARRVGTGQPDAASVASMAKAFVGDCSIDVAQNCFQVFGGIGYTWEHDQHLFLRRLTTDAALYGEPAWHRERVCQLAGL
jgi:alkylation response protein AidB-like acyl-CoA dehydrogenase